MTFFRNLNRPLLAASTLVGIAVAVFFAWTQWQWHGADALDDLGEMAAAFVGAAICSVAAWRHHGRSRAAWALLAASAVMWGAGEAIWTWYDLALHQQVPFPSPADAGYLGAVPLAVAGALALPGARQRGTTRVASALDGLIVAAGLLAVSWVTVLHAVYSAGGDTVFAQVLSIAYPAGDVVIATILATLLIRMPRGNRLPVVLVVAGLAGNALADSSFAYLSAQGTYGSGNSLDTGWFAGYLLLALGAFRACLARADVEADEMPPSRWRLVVPYVPTVAAMAVAAIEVIQEGSLEPVLFWIVVALVVLVVCRQFLTLSTNHDLLRDLGEREADMRHQAYHDPLTGLANRALFRRRVDAALAPVDVGRAPLVAVIVIDLDDFKDVNDTYGHEAGDRLLVEVGARLLGCVRDVDTVARLGGDEFAVLLETVSDRRHAELVAERIVATVRHSADIGPAAVGVQASVGVALTRSSRLSRPELLRRADVAMYAAKGQGKGRWATYEPEIDLADGPASERATAAS